MADLEAIAAVVGKDGELAEGKSAGAGDAPSKGAAATNATGAPSKGAAAAAAAAGDAGDDADMSASGGKIAQDATMGEDSDLDSDLDASDDEEAPGIGGRKSTTPAATADSFVVEAAQAMDVQGTMGHQLFPCNDAFDQLRDDFKDWRRAAIAMDSYKEAKKGGDAAQVAKLKKKFVDDHKADYKRLKGVFHAADSVLPPLVENLVTSFITHVYALSPTAVTDVFTAHSLHKILGSMLDVMVLKAEKLEPLVGPLRDCIESAFNLPDDTEMTFGTLTADDICELFNTGTEEDGFLSSNANCLRMLEFIHAVDQQRRGVKFVKTTVRPLTLVSTFQTLFKFCEQSPLILGIAGLTDARFVVDVEDLTAPITGLDDLTPSELERLQLLGGALVALTGGDMDTDEHDYPLGTLSVAPDARTLFEREFKSAAAYLRGGGGKSRKAASSDSASESEGETTSSGAGKGKLSEAELRKRKNARRSRSRKDAGAVREVIPLSALEAEAWRRAAAGNTAVVEARETDAATDDVLEFVYTKRGANAHIKRAVGPVVYLSLLDAVADVNAVIAADMGSQEGRPDGKGAPTLVAVTDPDGYVSPQSGSNGFLLYVHFTDGKGNDHVVQVSVRGPTPAGESDVAGNLRSEVVAVSRDVSTAWQLMWHPNDVANWRSAMQTLLTNMLMRVDELSADDGTFNAERFCAGSLKGMLFDDVLLQYPKGQTQCELASGDVITAATGLDINAHARATARLSPKRTPNVQYVTTMLARLQSLADSDVPTVVSQIDTVVSAAGDDVDMGREIIVALAEMHSLHPNAMVEMRPKGDAAGGKGAAKAGGGKGNFEMVSVISGSRIGKSMGELVAAARPSAGDVDGESAAAAGAGGKAAEDGESAGKRRKTTAADEGKDAAADDDFSEAAAVGGGGAFSASLSALVAAKPLPAAPAGAAGAAAEAAPSPQQAASKRSRGARDDADKTAESRATEAAEDDDKAAEAAEDDEDDGGARAVAGSSGAAGAGAGGSTSPQRRSRRSKRSRQ